MEQSDLDELSVAETQDFLHAASEACQRRAPILSSTSAFGPSTAVLDEPAPEPAAPQATFQTLLARGLLAAAAATCFFVAAGAALFFGAKWLLGSTTAVALAWLGVEMAFWVWFRQHAMRLDAQPQPHRPAAEDPLLHFKRLHAHARFYSDVCKRPVDWANYVSLWFKSTPIQQVSLENLRDMVGYGFWYRTRAELQASGQWSAVEAAVEELRALPAGPLGVKGENALCSIKPGFTPGLEYMAHLWEPLRWHHRPLALYLATEAAAILTAAALWGMGFQVGAHNGDRYFFKPAAPTPVAPAPRSPYSATGNGTGAAGSSGVGGSVGSNDRPILLLHGVGLGLMPYLMLVARLAASKHAVLCPEFKHIGMRLCSRVPCCSEVAAKVAAVMDKVGMNKACVVAHSYGTFIGSRLVQARRERVASLALIDPVCFGMFLPSLLNNFVYRTPGDVLAKKGVLAAMKAAMLHIISRDVHCAASVCRRFFWTDINLWPEELPPLSLVVLSGQDELLHADEVRQVVTGSRYIGVKRGPKPMSAADAFPHLAGKHNATNTTNNSTNSNNNTTATSGVRVTAPSHTLYTMDSACDLHSRHSLNAHTSPLPRPSAQATAPRGASTAAPPETAPAPRTASSALGPGAPGPAPWIAPLAPPTDARVLYHPTASHAAFLMDSAWQMEVVEQILSLADEEAPVQHVLRRKTTLTSASHTMATALSSLAAHASTAHPAQGGALAGSARRMQTCAVWGGVRGVEDAAQVQEALHVVAMFKQHCQQQQQQQQCPQRTVQKSPAHPHPHPSHQQGLQPHLQTGSRQCPLKPPKSARASMESSLPRKITPSGCKPSLSHTLATSCPSGWELGEGRRAEGLGLGFRA